MKRFVLILSVAISIIACAQTKEEGIEFFHGTFSEVLEKAEKENKIVFIDFYTKWCGPCKVMAKGTFTKPEVGKFYNDNFINYKVDAEVGEGPELAKKYEVTGFPTLVFIDSKGTVLASGIGAKNVEQLINMGRKALGEDIKDLAWYQAEYDKGNRDAGFLKKYYELRAEEQRVAMSQEESWDLYQAYSEEEKWESEAVEMAFWKASVGNKFYELVKNNKSKFPGLANKSLHVRWFHHVANHPESDVEKNNLEQVAKDFPEFADQALELHEIEEYRMQSKYTEYIPLIIAYAEKYGEPMDYNLMLMTTVNRTTDVKPEHALHAAQYFKQIIDEDTTHFYTMSGYAYCLYIAGEKDAAIEFVKKYRSLTDQYATNKKMQWCYETMNNIENGGDVAPFYIPEMK
ncbi:MAG: thioredoxin family protein [Carboxylicivirga sp.]|jgi:thioredoxin-related protein|nr:thioredoxin family protein [Carboxylicivirga sp.]